MKYILIVAFVFILSGCSSPATPEDIKVAIQKCPEVRSSISFEINCVRCDSSPITKRKLRSLVNDCQENADIKADLSSPENLLKAQRAALVEPEYDPERVERDLKKIAELSDEDVEKLSVDAAP